MDRLRGENEALLRRLGDLEDEVKKQAGTEEESVGKEEKTDGAVGSGLIPKESFELAVKEKKELEDVAKQKEKRLLRLQQVYPPPSHTSFLKNVAC